MAQIPPPDDPFWAANGQLPVEFEKLPIQVYAVKQGDVTVYLALEEIDRLIALAYGTEIDPAGPSPEQLAREKSAWDEANRSEPAE